MNLPASPTNGQIATVNGRSYQWNSTLSVWRAISGTAGGATGFTSSDTAPSSVADGWMWWAPSTGVLSVRLESTWVEINSSGIPAGGMQFGGAVSTKPLVVPFSASIIIDASLSNVFLVGTMTANNTLTINNGYDGQTINVRLVQDSAGGRNTNFLGTTVKATDAGNGSPNQVVWLIVTYVAASSRWEGAWTVVPA